MKSANAKAAVVGTTALNGPDFLKGMAAMINEGGPLDVAKLKAVTTRHGLVLVLPPKGT